MRLALKKVYCILNSSGLANVDYKAQLRDVFCLATKERHKKIHYAMIMHLLKDVNIHACKIRSSSIYADIRNIMSKLKYSSESNYEEKMNLLTELISDFFATYNQKERRLTLSREEKDALMARQNYKCAISGEAIRSGMEWEVDHAVALAIGGSDTKDNLQIVLKHINRKKSVSLSPCMVKATHI